MEKVLTGPCVGSGPAAMLIRLSVRRWRLPTILKRLSNTIVRVCLLILLLLPHGLARGDSDSTVLSFDGRKTPEVEAKQLPIEVLTAPASNLRAGELRRWLKRRPSLELNGAALLIGPDAGVVLSIDTLTLRNGARVITDGAKLTVYANRIVSDKGAIISFAKDALQPASGAPRGLRLNGRSGGEVRLSATDGLEGSIDVDLRGQNGGDGAKGGTGKPGRAGARGSNAVQGGIDCRAGGGDGSAGMRGENGEVGARGGDGGDGGTLTLDSNLSDYTQRIHFIAVPGQPGRAGVGGDGGPGGPGGSGGSGSFSCSGGRAGPAGAEGAPGAPGEEGKSGKPGQRLVEKKAGRNFFGIEF